MPGTGSTDGPDDVVDRLWAAASAARRPRRGPKPALTLAGITEAAIAVADADGLPAVSMARVAESLGYTPMALYRYVRGKDELLALMADAAAGDPPGIPAGTPWRPALEIWVRTQLERVVQRPWFLDLPLATASPGPGRLRWVDQAIGLLSGLDLTGGEKFEVVGMLAQHVLGEARVHVEAYRASLERVRQDGQVPPDVADADIDPATLAAADPWAGFGATLARYATPQDYPAIFALLAEDGFEDEVSATDDVSFALSVALDGVEAFVERRRRERARQATSDAGA